MIYKCYVIVFILGIDFQKWDHWVKGYMYIANSPSVGTTICINTYNLWGCLIHYSFTNRGCYLNFEYLPICEVRNCISGRFNVYFFDYEQSWAAFYVLKGYLPIFPWMRNCFKLHSTLNNIYWFLAMKDEERWVFEFFHLFWHVILLVCPLSFLMHSLSMYIGCF